MNLSQHMLDPPEYPLQGFGGKPIKPVGKISLPVSFGDLENARTESLTFDVVDIYHPYLAIFGRGFMNKFDAVIRQQFLCMKMPPVLMKYLEKVREMEKHFKGYSVQHIPRDDNNEADKLAKAAVRNQELPPGCVLRNHQRTVHQGFESQNREYSGDSRLESRNHGLSERTL
jgi:hypothetical protein